MDLAVACGFTPQNRVGRAIARLGPFFDPFVGTVDLRPKQGNRGFRKQYNSGGCRTVVGRIGEEGVGATEEIRSFQGDTAAAI
jgi:hypothetical protein